MTQPTRTDVLNRVPKIIAIYWIIKIASTTLGETGADMFSMTYDLGYATTILIFLSIFAVLLGIKLWIRRYEPITYWLTFTASAVAGTALCDFIDRDLGLGYGWGSLLLFSSLLVILAIWYAVERSISVEWITKPSAELFYWAAFLVANTLGTAAGDYVADDLELGFFVGAGIFSGILLVTLGLHYFTKVSWILLFWIAFVMTRPFGATFGDFLTKTRDQGGLDLGTEGASIFFALLMVVAIAWEIRHPDKTVRGGDADSQPLAS